MSKKEEKLASYYFHHPKYGFNCAQAVLFNQKEHKGVDNGLINQMSHFGGGRAPNGICGALYAAQLLNSSDGIIDKFRTIVGAVDCRTIRETGAVSCKSCVDLADELVDTKG